MSRITIRCFSTDFVFSNTEEESAWYSFDHAVSRAGEETLELNADREVYGIYTGKDGIRHFGTIGDCDNEVLADNYPCEEHTLYLFYENPATEEYYV